MFEFYLNKDKPLSKYSPYFQ